MTTDAHDLGLLTLRVGVGGTLMAHGAQKLFGWFGGGGLAGTGGFFDSVGFTPGKLNAALAGAGEAGGGALLALGGPGQLSLDAALGHKANQPWMRAAGIAAIPAAAALVFKRRNAALALASATVPAAEVGSGEPHQSTTA